MKVKNFFRKFFKSLAYYFVILITLINSGLAVPAFAKGGELHLPKGRETEFAENNIIFYNPEGSECNTTTTPGITPSGDEVTWIGDSYTEGSKSLIEDNLSGASIDGANGRHWDTGLSILEEIVNAGELRPYLVFALGTNDGNGAPNIDRLTELAGSETKIILVTAYTVKDKGTDRYKEHNSAITSAGSSHSNITVADWASVAQDSYYDDDAEKVHPTGHYDVWVSTIMKAFGKATGISNTVCNDDCFSDASLVDGTTARDIVWNWFVTHTEAGISNNASAIAGALGNLSHESGFNPFAKGGSYYGIYQTNSDGLKDAIDAKGWDIYWGKTLGEIPANIVNEAIDIELSILITTGRWRGANGYSDNINNVTHSSGVEGASSYAELFEVLVERAVCEHGGKIFYGNAWHQCSEIAQELTDPGVIAVRDHMYPNGPIYDYQGLAARRETAKKIFNELAGGSGFSCDDDIIPRNNGDINATAISLAWPKGHDNVNWDNPRPTYQSAMKDINIWQVYSGDCLPVGGSCDMFVGTVMRYSGADPNFPIFLGEQKTYLARHPEKYQAINANTQDYRPGDIRVENNYQHIVIIVQLEDGTYNIAAASRCAATGHIHNQYYSDSGTIYRLKGSTPEP